MSQTFRERVAALTCSASCPMPSPGSYIAGTVDMRVKAEAIATEADAAIASRDAEIARLREDAERYRWLRSKPFDWHIEHVSHGWATTYGSRELDAAIDAARKKG